MNKNEYNPRVGLFLGIIFLVGGAIWTWIVYSSGGFSANIISRETIGYGATDAAFTGLGDAIAIVFVWSGPASIFLGILGIVIAIFRWSE